MKEFTTAMEDLVAEQEGVEEKFTEFNLDGVTLRSYHPTEGQLLFMMAAMGRGQSDQSRFASIINIMLSTFKDSDRDHFEGRLLSRDPKDMLPVKQVEQIFEFLTEEWFARPTTPPSDSVGSPPTGGDN